MTVLVVTGRYQVGLCRAGGTDRYRVAGTTTQGRQDR